MAPRKKKFRLVQALDLLAERPRKPIAVIAKTFGMGRVTFEKRMREFGHPVAAARGRPPRTVDLDLVAHLARSCSSWKELAAQLSPKVSPPTIAAAFARAGRQPPSLRGKAPPLPMTKEKN